MGDDTHDGQHPAGAVTEVVNRTDERYYDLLVDGQAAGMVIYELASHRYVLTHTVIAEGYQGRGLSQVLLRGVLDDLRERQLTVTVYCPVVGHFVESNPEYRPLLDPHHPGNWGDQPGTAGGPATTSA
jgi:predicted GNAT family acetyltransferase